MNIPQRPEPQLSRRELEEASVVPFILGKRGILAEKSEAWTGAHTPGRLVVSLRDAAAIHHRAMTAIGASGSNYLVGTATPAQDFIDLLRSASVTLRMGVTRLTGLRSNVTVPKMVTGQSAHWLVDENTPITESQPEIGQLALTPKAVAALTKKISHQLQQQAGPALDALLLNDLREQFGSAVDVGVLNGSGLLGQPTGVRNTAGVGSVSGTSFGVTGALECQTDVAASKALMPGCGYVTTPTVAGLLMQRVRFASTASPLWEGSLDAGQILGVQAMSTLNCPASTLFFGRWQSVVLADWGVLELVKDEATHFTTGEARFRAILHVDVGVLHPGAFTIAQSIT